MPEIVTGRNHGAAASLTVYPALYCLYAMIRGGMTGFWPYPFLDVDQLGMVRVSLNIAGMLALVAVVGAGVLAVARRSA